MQTFLPMPSFRETAELLDYRRLGKQRVETMQIMITLLTGRGWVHHPAVKMWEGYESALLQYQEAICEEWLARGYKDTCFEKTQNMFWAVNDNLDMTVDGMPFWLGNPLIHEGHQSNLIRKDPEFYGPIFPDIPDDLPYYWPV